jgi:GNAT superfamily N-acetyltransferase
LAEELVLRARPGRVDAAQIVDLYVSVGWGQRDAYKHSDVEAMFAATAFFVLAEVGGKLAGAIRVLSDRVSVSWIAEIAVRPEFQRTGIGRALIDAVIGELGHTAIYAEAAAGAEGFFEAAGIRPRPRHLVACSRGPSSAR